MNEERDSLKGKLAAYAICVAVAVGLLLLVLTIGGYWKAEDPMDRARILCDGFSVPGALLVLAAGILFASGQGAFNGVLRSEYVPYREFVKRRAKKKVTGYGCLFFVGLLFLIVGIVLTVRFNRLYP